MEPLFLVLKHVWDGAAESPGIRQRGLRRVRSRDLGPRAAGEEPEPQEPGDPARDDRLPLRFDDVTDRCAVIARERREAAGLLAELRALPEEPRRRAIRRERRYSSWHLSALAIDGARFEALEAPEQAEELLEIGFDVLGRLSSRQASPSLLADLAVRSWAEAGHLCRLRGDLAAAEVALDAARTSARQGSGDLLEAARVFEVEAALRRDLGRFREAAAAADKAIAIYRSCDEPEGLGRACVERGRTQALSGDLEGAARSLRSGLANLWDPRDRSATLAAHLSLIGVLLESERHRPEARFLLETLRPELLARDGDLLSAQYCWLDGCLFAALGNRAEAEGRLLEARAGFARAHRSVELALATLDLAVVLGEGGRIAELRVAVAEIPPLLAASALPEKALAAIEKSLRRERLDLKTLRASERLLRRTRRERFFEVFPQRSSARS